MKHARSRKLKALVATLAVAALAAPVTQATVDGGSVRGTPVPWGIADSGSVRGTPIPWGATDAKHQALVDSNQQILLRHEAAGKLVLGSHPSAVTSGGGTDWGDVGVASGAAFVLVLLGTGTVLVSRKKLATA